MILIGNQRKNEYVPTIHLFNFQNSRRETSQFTQTKFSFSLLEQLDVRGFRHFCDTCTKPTAALHHKHSLASTDTESVWTRRPIRF